MPDQESAAPRRDGLRLWPGVVIVLLQWVLRFGLELFPDYIVFGVAAGIAGWPALIIWWLFFSRAAWSERIAGIAVMMLALAVTWPFLDVSMSTGAMGALFPMLAAPGICLAFILWAVLTRGSSAAVRRTTLVIAILLSCAVWTLVRTGGFTGSFDNDLAWRWSPTPEERLLAQNDATPAVTPTAAPSSASAPAASEVPQPAVAPSPNPVEAVASHDESHSAGATSSDVSRAVSNDWPGFRGSSRDSVVHGVRINTDWQASPPVELWRRPVGPGWSSFAVHGDVFYTQEQRGEDEIVAAYRVSTGAPVWMHRDTARFWESNGGAGPRATPTLSNGRLYTFGATGILNVLEASDGRVVWSRNVSADSQSKVPDWGFASSPLIVGDLVIVAAAGKLVAYDLASGTLRWVGPDGGAGYSSPQAVTLNGVQQVVLLDAHGATGVVPADGKKLWDVSVPTTAMAAPIVQPAFTVDNDLLVADGMGGGLYRVALAARPGGWTTTERWVSTGLKPNFNDFVVHNGHAFGFDGSILSCIDLADGKRKWKGGRYGNGQMLLLADQDVLLVTSEEGDLALVAATPDKFTELARVPAIEGKTWNHPVLVGDILLVRNGEEMAAFKLSLAHR